MTSRNRRFGPMRPWNRPKTCGKPALSGPDYTRPISLTVFWLTASRIRTTCAQDW
jgi:hypothetical protein